MAEGDLDLLERGVAFVSQLGIGAAEVVRRKVRHTDGGGECSVATLLATVIGASCAPFRRYAGFLSNSARSVQDDHSAGRLSQRRAAAQQRFEYSTYPHELFKVQRFLNVTHDAQTFTFVGVKHSRR